MYVIATCIYDFSGFCNGGGELKFSTPLAGELAAALRHSRGRGALSKSEGDLRPPAADTGTLRLYNGVLAVAKGVRSGREWVGGLYPPPVSTVGTSLWYNGATVVVAAR